MISPSSLSVLRPRSTVLAEIPYSGDRCVMPSPIRQSDRLAQSSPPLALVAGGQQTDILIICQTGGMEEARAAAVMAESAAVLRTAGARFAYLHGSRARARHRPDSDIDIAAYFGGQPPQAFDVLMPSGVDLLVLNRASLELAGRVAVDGKLLFDDDPVSRVRWEATTRKIYFDELPRITRAHREFAASVTGRHGMRSPGAP